MNTNTSSPILQNAFLYFGILPDTKPAEREHQISIEFKTQFDKYGPYQMAKELNVLVNGSADDFAIAWMTFYNTTFGPAY